MYARGRDIMIIVMSLLLALVLCTLFELIKIERKQEDIITALEEIRRDKGGMKGKLFEGIKEVAKNTDCYITVLKDCLQIVAGDNTNQKFNIRLNKITNFEIMANKDMDCSKEDEDESTSYFLIIRFVNKNNNIDVISFQIYNPEYKLVEYVNNIIKKDSATDL